MPVGRKLRRNNRALEAAPGGLPKQDGTITPEFFAKSRFGCVVGYDSNRDIPVLHVTIAIVTHNGSASWTTPSFTPSATCCAREGIAFREVQHAPTFTSEESANARGEDVRIGGKALLIKTDQTFASSFSAPR